MLFQNITRIFKRVELLAFFLFFTLFAFLLIHLLFVRNKRIEYLPSNVKYNKAIKNSTTHVYLCMKSSGLKPLE